jgi:hypothetical protein
VTVNWERDLPDMSLPAEGEAPATDGPVVAYLRGLLANPDVAKATKVVVLTAYEDDEEYEHICRYQHGVTFSEQVGLVTYHYERLRRQVVGAEEE